jgi:hypothetical protein
LAYESARAGAVSLLFVIVIFMIQMTGGLRQQASYSSMEDRAEIRRQLIEIQKLTARRALLLARTENITRRLQSVTQQVTMVESAAKAGTASLSDVLAVRFRLDDLISEQATIDAEVGEVISEIESRRNVIDLLDDDAYVDHWWPWWDLLLFPALALLFYMAARIGRNMERAFNEQLDTYRTAPPLHPPADAHTRVHGRDSQTRTAQGKPPARSVGRGCRPPFMEDRTERPPARRIG